MKRNVSPALGLQWVDYLGGEKGKRKGGNGLADEGVGIVTPQEAPSGMMARGHYDAVSKFMDDDLNTHLKFEWSFDITKSW